MLFKTAIFKFSRDQEKDAFDDSKIVFLAKFQKMSTKTTRYYSSDILGNALDDSRIVF
jgi:hypothetical protein